jgi:UDP-N-acetylmuramoyl-tripeptide--D-alanyl-D-alanine ligase
VLGLEELAQQLEGELLRGTGARPCRVVLDSRHVVSGDLFVALPGARTDGHRHLREAFARGACATMVSNTAQLPDTAHDVLVVPDTAVALQAWAAAHRHRLRGTVLGITGTNGKTTVKQMLHHILSATASTYASPHNYNTEIGLPLSLLSMPHDAQFGVFEMGAERPGDIRFLAGILQPTWAVITSVGPGHLDGLTSVERVAAEKWSLAESLPKTGTVLVPADSAPLTARAAHAHCTVIRAGFDDGDVNARLLRTVPSLQLQIGDRKAPITCPLLGAHNAINLLLACVTAHRLGVDWETVAAQAATLTPVPHRLQPRRASFGTLLDDTYNANPASTSAALRVLCDVVPGASPRVFVFGQMEGLGNHEARYHREVLQHALSLPVDEILPVGAAAEAACREETSRAVRLLPREEIAARLKTLGPSAVVLIKGSRGLRMETLVEEALRID